MAIPHVATSPKCHSMMRGVLRPLIGLEIDNLRIPINVAREFEPSQFGTIVGTLVDALLPSIALKLGLGLEKAEGILGDREGYPDFINSLGYRIELKGLFKDNLLLDLKRPPTRREASARLTQKVTRKNVITETDLLLLLCYQMEPYSKDASVVNDIIFITYRFVQILFQIYISSISIRKYFLLLVI